MDFTRRQLSWMVASLMLLALVAFNWPTIMDAQGQVIRVVRANLQVSGIPIQGKFSVVQGVTSNEVDIGITFLDGWGNVVPGAIADVYLSGASTGIGLTTVTASGSVGTAETSFGTGGAITGGCDDLQTAPLKGNCLDVGVSKKAFTIKANAQGQYTLQINDTAKTLFNVCIDAELMKKSGNCVTLTAANYL